MRMYTAPIPEHGVPEKKKIWTLPLVLLALYIVLTYTAQHTLLPEYLQQIAMYIYVVCAIMSILRSGRFALTSHFLWFLCMVFLAGTSLAWSSHPQYGSLITMVTAMILSYCIVHTVENFDQFDRIVVAFVVAADIMGLMLMATEQIDMDSEVRLGQEVSGNANVFSAFMMVAAVFAGWQALYKKGFLRAFSVVSFIFQLLLMSLSGGRKTIIAALACFLWFVVMRDRSKATKVLGNVLKAAVVLYVIYWLVMNVEILYTAIGERFEGLFAILDGKESDVAGDEMRLRMVEIGLEGWLKSPILGHGLDMYKYYNLYSTGHFYYAHNNYVELLYDLGVIGIVLYYTFYVYMFKKLYALPEIFDKYKILGSGVLFGLLFYDFGGISFYNAWIQIVVALMYCILTAAGKELAAIQQTQAVILTENEEQDL